MYSISAIPERKVLDLNYFGDALRWLISTRSLESFTDGHKQSNPVTFGHRTTFRVDRESTHFFSVFPLVLVINFLDAISQQTQTTRSHVNKAKTQRSQAKKKMVGTNKPNEEEQHREQQQPNNVRVTRSDGSNSSSGSNSIYRFMATTIPFRLILDPQDGSATVPGVATAGGFNIADPSLPVHYCHQSDDGGDDSCQITELMKVLDYVMEILDETDFVVTAGSSDVTTGTNHPSTSSLDEQGDDVDGNGTFSLE